MTIRLIIRPLLFLFCLELFLRLGGAASISIQDYQNKAHLKDAHAYRIMCIGESTTFAGGKESYPSQLERILNDRAKGKRFEVINRGIPGSDSADIVANLKKDIELYKPNMVIAMVGINDSDNTVAYTDSSSDKFKVAIGDIRIIRVGKFLWAHIMQELGQDAKPLSAIDRLKKEIKIHPKGSGAYIELGQYYIEQREFKLAEALFKKGISINPKKDWGYEQLAKVYLLQGRVDEVEKLYLLAVSKNPKKSWSYALLSRFYADQKKEVLAERALKDGLDKNPDDMDIFIELGSFYTKQARFSDAEDLYAKAKLKAPQNSKIYAQLGFCYGAQGRYDDMEAMIDTAAEIDSKNVQKGDRLHVILDLVDWYMKRNQFSRAEVVLKNALVKYPQSVEIIRGLANIYNQTDMKDKALVYINMADALSEKKPLNATISNYRQIIKIVQGHHIDMVVSSYATRHTHGLEKMLDVTKGVLFIDNGIIFKQALTQGKYETYFTDAFAGDFGHCTPKGAGILADNIARHILLSNQI